MRDSQAQFLNACRLGDIKQLNFGLNNSMFNPRVYTRAGMLCVEHNQLEALKILLQRNVIKSDLDLLAIEAIGTNNLQCFDMLLPHLDHHALQYAYIFCIENNSNLFSVVHPLIDVNFYPTAAKHLDRSTHQHIFLTLFPFSENPDYLFTGKFYANDVSTCVEILQINPSLNRLLDQMIKNEDFAERLDHIRCAVQKAEISAHLPAGRPSQRKM